MPGRAWRPSCTTAGRCGSLLAILRRANSVHPLYPSMDDDEEKARLCLRLYRDRGLPAVFKLTPAATIDGLLGRLGYVTEADSLVLMKDLGELPPPSRTDIELLPQVTSGWVAAYCMLERSARRHFSTIMQMMSRLATSAGFLVLREEGEVVGMGMGVVEQDYLGLFSLVTRQSKRNQGIGHDAALHSTGLGPAPGRQARVLASTAGQRACLKPVPNAWV